MPGPETSRRTSDRSAPAEAAGPGESVYAQRPWLASYPPGVPADVDVPDVPLTRLLDDAASSFPATTAIAFHGTKISYKELKDAVDRFATALAGLGVRKGVRVAVVLPNCPQNVIATYAALRLGAVVVQHNPLYTQAEMHAQLADCGATVVVCLDRVYDTVARARRDTAVAHVVVTSLADYLPTLAKLSLRLPLRRSQRARAEVTAALPKDAPVRQFLQLLRSTGLPSRQVPLDPHTDLALLQYTGGTTGPSKGAMLTHANLVSNAYMNRLWDTGATPGKEVCLAVLPLFHVYGLTVCMNATMLLGGTLVLLPRFDLDQVFAAIDQWKPTMFPGVPPIYKAISDSPKARSHDLRSIRVCVSGAMKLPAEVQDQFERVTGARLVEGYGMTETSPSTHCNPIIGRRKPGSIGLPLPSTHVKVVEQDDHARAVPPGEPGELAIRGPQVFRGYWGCEGDEGVFTHDGYVLTGDIAVMDDDGYFAIVDRKKEIIIAGGFNIYPSEVEEVLLRLPGVVDAVVVGIPDRYRGEAVKAFVVREPGSDLTEDDVVAHCAIDLTAYKVPKVVEFRDELPRTPVGKVLRRVLLEQEPPAATPIASRPTGTVRSAGRKAVGKKAVGTKAPGEKAVGKKVVGTKVAGGKAVAKKAAAPVQQAAGTRQTPSTRSSATPATTTTPAPETAPQKARATKAREKTPATPAPETAPETAPATKPRGRGKAPATTAPAEAATAKAPVRKAPGTKAAPTKAPGTKAPAKAATTKPPGRKAPAAPPFSRQPEAERSAPPPTQGDPAPPPRKSRGR